MQHLAKNLTLFISFNLYNIPMRFHTNPVTNEETEKFLVYFIIHSTRQHDDKEAIGSLHITSHFISW